MGLCCITTVPIMICMDGQKTSFVYYSILEINVIIALLAAYGFNHSIYNRLLLNIL